MVWKVNIEEDEEFHAYPVQVKVVVHRVIEAHEGKKIDYKDNRLVPIAATTKFLFPVLHSKNHVVELCQILVH
jgi:hypothetical protein